MRPAELLLALRSAGLVLDVSGSALLVTPAGKLTDELRSLTRALKDELVDLVLHEGSVETFEERAAIMQFDGGMTRLQAEAAARIVIDRARRNHKRGLAHLETANLPTGRRGREGPDGDDHEPRETP